MFKAEFEDSQFRLLAIDSILKSTFICHTFLPVITTMSDEAFFDLDQSHCLINRLVVITDLTFQISSLMDTTDEHSKNTFQRKVFPTPWSSEKVLESCHPLRDNYKFKETIRIPSARCLFLKFDSRCSSQYDYDKLVVHAGK